VINYYLISVCGVKNREGTPNFVPQVSSGVPAHPNEWPWIVFINHARDARYYAVSGTCGGALISPRYWKFNDL